MKPRLKLNQARRLCAALPAFYAALIFIVQANDAPRPANAAAPKSSAPIPWSQLGAKAGADYQGDGLAVIPTPAGARLRCVFQRLEGEATREGLWLSSTVRNSVNDRFRIVAATIGREAGSVERRSVQRDSVEAGALARPPDALSLYAPRCHAQRLS